MLPRLIKNTVEMIQAISPDYKIQFVNKDVSTVFADKGRIEQILINLLTNAVKYSLRNKNIKITTKKGRKEVIIKVQDWGSGIEEQHIDKIFERFYRTASAEKNKLPGLGMGLYISHEIVHIHGGKMWVKSKYGKGSSFYFSLPVE